MGVNHTKSDFKDIRTLIEKVSGKHFISIAMMREKPKKRGQLSCPLAVVSPSKSLVVRFPIAQGKQFAVINPLFSCTL